MSVVGGDEGSSSSPTLVEPQQTISQQHNQQQQQQHQRSQHQQRASTPLEDKPTLPEGADPEKISKLLEAWSFLCRDDSIMEPKVMFNVRQFIKCGGRPEDVLRSLTSSYRGYAEMVNLVSEWLQFAGVGADEIVSSVQKHLRDLIVRLFDPKKADTIFQEGPSAPEWLEAMIQEPFWRSLIYQLSEEHKDCLMLNFAIQRISAAGSISLVCCLIDRLLEHLGRIPFRDSSSRYCFYLL